MRHAVRGLPALRPRFGLGLLLVRHLAKRQRHGLGFALAQHGELHRGARRHRADLAGEIARILDRLAIDSGDDVTRLDSGFGGRAAGLRLVDQRAFGLFSCRGCRRCLRSPAAPARPSSRG